VRAESEPPFRGAPDTEQCLSSAAPDCLVPLDDKASNGHKLQNPNGWVTWLAHRTIRCAHRQQPSPTVVWWFRAINTPQPPPLQPSKHSTHCIQYKSNRLHSKTQIKAIDPLKVSSALGLVRGSLVFLVALVCLVGFLFFSLLLSSAL
jgi:hypothetical protein